MTQQEAADLSLTIFEKAKQSADNDIAMPKFMKIVDDQWVSDSPNRSMFNSINNKITKYHKELANLTGEKRSNMYEAPASITRDSVGDLTNFSYVPDDQMSIKSSPFLEVDPYALNKAALKLDDYYHLLYMSQSDYKSPGIYAGDSTTNPKYTRYPNGWWYVSSSDSWIRSSITSGDYEKTLLSSNSLLIQALQSFQGSLSFGLSSTMRTATATTSSSFTSNIGYGTDFIPVSPSEGIIAFIFDIANSNYLWCVNVTGVTDNSPYVYTFSVVFSYGDLPSNLTNTRISKGWPKLTDGAQKTYLDASSVTYLLTEFKYARDAYLLFIDSYLYRLKVLLNKLLISNYDAGEWTNVTDILSVISTRINTDTTKLSTSLKITTLLSNLSTRLTNVLSKEAKILDALGNVVCTTGEVSSAQGSGLYLKRFKALVTRFNKAYGTLCSVLSMNDSVSAIKYQKNANNASTSLTKDFLYVSDVSDILSSRDELFIRATMPMGDTDLDLTNLLTGAVVVISEDAVAGYKLFYHANVIKIATKSKSLKVGLRPNKSSSTGFSSLVKKYINIQLDRKIPIGYEVSKTGGMRVVKFLDDSEIEVLPEIDSSGRIGSIHIGNADDAIIGRT